ncbi:MFS transporter [Paenibacillus thalictri]|uniref:MFS transporter n=1 Tax=Paenibacillus thalictri TaxID=2527873 RepID=A0A4Q9DXQ2_9BACL|nr:MFS transporter [Paenibacillus thalictri]TBL80578.1 MFS transporter [Paenibacillus thalictri]
MIHFKNGFASHPTLKLLQLSALIRSMCQGIALVSTSLYLKELGWSGGTVGLLFAAAGLFRTLASSFAGELNGFLGPKRYLLLFEALTGAAALTIMLTNSGIALCAAVICAGFGMGHTGSGGPAAPIERRWIGAFGRIHANSIFGVNALLSYWGLSIGSLFAALTPYLQPIWPGAQAYRPLFGLIAAFSLAGILLLINIRGGERRKTDAPIDERGHAGGVQPPPSDAKTRTRDSHTLELGAIHDEPKRIQDAAPSPKPRKANIFSLLTVVFAVLLALSFPLWDRKFPLGAALVPVSVLGLLVLASVIRAWRGPRDELLTLVHLLNSIAVALTGTMTSYWLAVKFEVPAYSIGLVISVSYFLTGIVSLLIVHASNKFGAVKPVVTLQLAGALCVLALPWTPWFWAAAVLNAGGTMLNLGTRGSRAAVMNEQTKRSKRTWRSRATSFLLRLGTILWPGAFGHLIDAGEFALPFYIAGFVQVVSTIWYGAIHRSAKLPPK